MKKDTISCMGSRPLSLCRDYVWKAYLAHDRSGLKLVSFQTYEEPTGSRRHPFKSIKLVVRAVPKPDPRSQFPLSVAYFWSDMGVAEKNLRCRSWTTLCYDEIGMYGVEFVNPTRSIGELKKLLKG